MGTQNQDQNRQTQGTPGKTKQPQDPKLNPDRDDDNSIERRTSDDGRGRDQSAAGNRAVDNETDVDETDSDETGRGSQSDADRMGKR